MQSTEMAIFAITDGLNFIIFLFIFEQAALKIQILVGLLDNTMI